MRKTSSFSVLLLASALSGCASMRTADIKGPDGTPHKLITCMKIENCYLDATEVCGGKYQIVNTSSEVGGDATGTSSMTKLLVKCTR